MSEKKGSFQAPLVCGVCEADHDVQWYCCDCKGNLCEPCKDKHTVYMPLFVNHKLVPIIEGLRQTSVEEECLEHQHRLYTLHCTQCKQLVCPTCIVEGHRGHDLEEISNAMDRVFNEIKVFSDSVKTQILTSCHTEKARVTEAANKSKEWFDTTKSEIDKRREEMKFEVDRAYYMLLNKAEEEMKEYLAENELEKQKMEEMEKQTEDLIHRGELALSQSNSEKISFNNDKPRLGDLHVPKTTMPQLSIYQPGKTNTAQISEQIGKFRSQKHQSTERPSNEQSAGIPRPDTVCAREVKIVSQKVYQFKIGSMRSVNKDEALIGDHLTKQLKFVDVTGKVKKCLDLKITITCLVLTSTGDIIATDYSGQCVRRMTRSGKILTYSTKLFKPSGICLINAREDMAVCVNSLDKSRSMLLIYSRSGDVIQSIRYTDKPVGEHWKQAVIQNERAEYCMAHSGQHKVFVVTNRGTPRFSYGGSSAGRMVTGFTPWDICGDNNGHLFVSDHKNHSVHMLDLNGRFLRYLLTENDRIASPTDLAVDAEGKIWVGQWNGGLCVVRLA